ncbi:hypothetical protein [Streptomyces sp. PT12]|nr:hypothetical protein [Streptomyces sp. PT12]
MARTQDHTLSADELHAAHDAARAAVAHLRKAARRASHAAREAR